VDYVLEKLKKLYCRIHKFWAYLDKIPSEVTPQILFFVETGAKKRLLL